MSPPFLLPDWLFFCLFVNNLSNFISLWKDFQSWAEEHPKKSIHAKKKRLILFCWIIKSLSKNYNPHPARNYRWTDHIGICSYTGIACHSLVSPAVPFSFDLGQTSVKIPALGQSCSTICLCSWAAPFSQTPLWQVCKYSANRDADVLRV